MDVNVWRITLVVVTGAVVYRILTMDSGSDYGESHCTECGEASARSTKALSRSGRTRAPQVL